MTVIVGLIDDGTVYMGCDSSMSYGDSIATMTYPQKLITVDLSQEFNPLGPHEIGISIGMSGSIRMLSIINAYAGKLPEIEWSFEKYITTAMVPWLIEKFAQSKIAVNDTKPIEYEGEMLIGGFGRLICIGKDFSTVETDRDCEAIGCASEYALGAMLATPRMKPKKRLLNAMKICEQACSAVRAPFHIVEV